MGYDVLIVEDDPMVAMIDKQYAEQLPQFRVVKSAGSGTEALGFIDSHEVQLIILDVYMPEMDGISFLNELRKRNYPADVIMVTAANDSETLGRALKLGILDYLVKPFSAARFKASLEKFLAQRKVMGGADGESVSLLSQKRIDNIISGHAAAPFGELPKGIRTETLSSVTEYLFNNARSEKTCEEVSKSLGLSLITVRRYLNYLANEGRVSTRVNYDTGGRPSVLYLWQG